MSTHRISYSEAELRLLQCTDEERLLFWRNSDRVRRHMFTDHVISREEHRRWFDNAMKDPESSHLVCVLRDRPVGLVSFTHISRAAQRCRAGFYVGEPHAPPGSGAIMAFLAIDYAVEKLGIRELCCEVFSFNHTVISLLEKFGFARDGGLCEERSKNGRKQSVIGLRKLTVDWHTDRAQLYGRCFTAGE